MPFQDVPQRDFEKAALLDNPIAAERSCIGRPLASVRAAAEGARRFAELPGSCDGRGRSRGALPAAAARRSPTRSPSRTSGRSSGRSSSRRPRR